MGLYIAQNLSVLIKFMFSVVYPPARALKSLASARYPPPTEKDPSLHAEVNAIRQAVQALGTAT